MVRELEQEVKHLLVFRGLKKSPSTCFFTFIFTILRKLIDQANGYQAKCPAFKPSKFKFSLSSILAGVAQWIERRPANQRVTGSILSQGTRLGCGPGPQ